MTHEYRQAIADYIRQEARPIDKYSHQPRLYRLASEIAAGMSYDDDILYAAVWLHDLGVFIGHRPEEIAALSRWDNVAYAVERVPALLTGWNFPAQKIPGVIDAIQNHLPSGDPQTIEGVILRDADILEQLGAVTILRTVSKVGRDTRFPTFAEALRIIQRQADSLPGQLRLARAKELAVERVTTLRVFLQAATMEAEGIEW